MLLVVPIAANRFRHQNCGGREEAMIATYVLERARGCSDTIARARVRRTIAAIPIKWSDLNECAAGRYVSRDCERHNDIL